MASYYDFNEETDIVKNQRVKVSSGMWSGGSGTLTAFYTSSAQGNQSASFVNVYDKAETDSTREVQFAIGYANYNGLGSIGNSTKTTAGNRETAALYRQLANVLLPPGTDKFTFGNAQSASDDIFFVVTNRARQREKMDPGNWELRVGKESAKNMKLIDDSGATTIPTVNEAGRGFNVVSGSISSGTADTFRAAPAGGVGSFYPDLGIILLDAQHIATSASIQGSIGTGGIPRSADTFDNTQAELFKIISSGSYFAARREEEITSTMYFCRANNKHFNFSNNPTFTTTSSDGTEGVLQQSTFEGDPKTYITQIGLYGENNQLLAVAKLSKPVLKSFSREAVIKVKLDF